MTARGPRVSASGPAPSALRLEPAGATEWLLRKGLFALLRRLPPGGQVWLTGLLKRLRRRRHAGPPRLPGPGARPGDDAPALVCLTHDVDWRTCYEAVEEIASGEGERGFHSTFNFLTRWHYRPQPELLERLRREGFETGLHGREHDLALGGRPRARLARELREARDALGGPSSVRGFRAPALAASERLLSVLGELGFLYDSSLAAWSPYAGLRRRPEAYVYPGTGLWELPLTLQDDVLFREFRLTEAEALEVVKALLGAVRGGRGVFVFNGHPTILKAHPAFWRGLLEHLAATGARVVPAERAVALAAGGE